MKRKGSDFERQGTEVLNALVVDSEWKRIPGSGAIGTTLSEPLLTADIVGSVKSIPRKFKVECKVGYGGATQFALKKEWLDKVRMEADATFGIPILLGKFSGSRDGVKIFTVMDVETFASLINHITKLQEELDKRL
jgi:hypothetical protein